MDSEIVDAIMEWDSSPFSGGYEGLHGLADRGFSGAVTAGSARAFMLNGRLISIDEGSVSSFAAADGTAYEAPDPALPLLYAMQSRGEQQAQYYTNEKSISEADATLSSGNFTGYIELSENVLSGDYYTVYYGGKSMSVAFVGNSRQLLTDDEAFERADDEVGIYTVYGADLEVIDIPEPASSDDPTADTDEPTAQPSEQSETQSTDESATHSSSSVEDEGNDDEEPAQAGRVESVTPTPPSADADTTASEAASTKPTSPPETNGDTVPTQTTSTAKPSATTSDSSPTATESSPNGADSSAAASKSSTDQSTDEDVFSDEAQWRNAKTIPSLEPSNDPPEAKGASSAAQQSRSASSQRQSNDTRSNSQGQLSRTQLQQRLQRAETVMQKAEQQHEQLVAERDSAQDERDQAREELETVRTQLSEAQSEIDRLEAQLDAGSTADVSDMSTGGHSMSTTEALNGTNLLVRYASKGDATLEDAIAGKATQQDVKTNLRIEPHTTFESDELSVDGTPFETFLEGRIELAFTRWLVEEFLFDIQQTGNQTDLSGIYEAIPTINRAELRGTVSLGTDEDDDPVEASFDLVVRDKRDQPLFIVDFNESKQPVGGGMINSLVRDGSEIIQRKETFAGAFAVTTSYYKGDALDAAADATGGGLLSASRGKSFVYISRKQGFHLCLVEKLGDTFDLHVPEL